MLELPTHSNRHPCTNEKLRSTLHPVVKVFITDLWPKVQLPWLNTKKALKCRHRNVTSTKMY